MPGAINFDFLIDVSGGGGDGSSTWPYLVLTQDSETTPVQVGTVSTPVSGRVFSYTLSGVTQYRLVPDTYVESEDAFYKTFDGTILSEKIASRS